MALSAISKTTVVCLGGGHGLAATLKALRRITPALTAIVTVADNGGSSGRLRKEFNQLPPGDLRMALAALCSDDEWGRSWAATLQHRFGAGELEGHAVGNLILTALWERDNDLVHGLDQVGELLRVIGRVLPMSLEPLDIEAKFQTAEGEKIVRGQVQVATSRGEVRSLSLIPSNPKATPDAIAAIMNAEWITLGPGSWLSSVMPHLLVTEQREALIATQARKIVVVNLPDPDDEMAESGVHEQLDLMHRIAPDLRCDFLLVDENIPEFSTQEHIPEWMMRSGVQIVRRELAERGSENGKPHHDSLKLTSAFSHIFEESLLR